MNEDAIKAFGKAFLDGLLLGHGKSKLCSIKYENDTIQFGIEIKVANPSKNRMEIYYLF